jgi:hypothetical protein
LLVLAGIVASGACETSANTLTGDRTISYRVYQHAYGPISRDAVW